MRTFSVLWCAAAAVVGAVLAVCSSAGAQVPLPNVSAEMNACLCLQQAAGTLAVQKDTKAQALAAANRQLTDLDAQLAAERPQVDVNNPDSVSRYKALLVRRDAAFGQISPAQADAARSVDRYKIGRAHV